MAYPDTEPFGTKLITSMVHYASYWGAPSASPTEGQLKLALDFSKGGPTTNYYLTVLGHLEGFTDATSYAVIDAWLNARESELIKLFFS